MTHSVDALFVFRMASAIFYVVLGAWVFTLTPRRRQTTLLGVYAVLFGILFLVVRVAQLLDYTGESGQLAFNVLATPLDVGASLALLALAWTVAQPLEDRRLLGIALVGGIVAGLLQVAEFHFRGGPLPDASTALFWAFVPRELAENALQGAAMFLLVLRAHPARRPERSQVVQLALLAMAVAAMGFGHVRGAVLVPAAGMLAQGEVAAVLAVVASVGVWLVWAGLWGWNMLRADGETVRIHRAAMLGILGLMAAGALVRSAFSESQATVLETDIVFTFGVGLLAYGVLRHDLAGLDAKVEWTISKTTVAGIFVAVFFIVSEGAQALFADFAGNEFLGVLAAGALVFAISPLQRLADRFAAKAVPGGAEAGADAEQRYREALHLAVADGEISPEEENRLADLAERLGIGHRRSLELRREVRDDAKGDAS